MRTSEEWIESLVHLAGEAEFRGDPYAIATMTPRTMLNVVGDLRDLAAMDRAVMARFVELFPNYAWTDGWTAIDLLVGEVRAARHERDEARDKLAAMERERDLLKADNEGMMQAGGYEYMATARDAAIRNADTLRNAAELIAKERDAAVRERDEAREKLAPYCEHSPHCILNSFDMFDPGPPRRWKYGGKWVSSMPACTCGLDAAIGGQA